MKCTDTKVGTTVRDPDGRVWEVGSKNWALASPPDQLTLFGGGEVRTVRDEDLAQWTVVARGAGEEYRRPTSTIEG